MKGKDRTKNILSVDSLDELLEKANYIIFSCDLDGNITSISKTRKVLSYTSNEFLTLNIKKIVAPEYQEFIEQMITGQIAEEEAHTPYEIGVIAKDGKRRTIEVFSRALHSQGKPVGIQNIARDITARKQAEEKLRKSEGRYRSIFENAPEVIFTLNVEDGSITSLNPAFEKKSGWKISEWLNKPFIPFIHPEDIPLALEKFEQVKRGESPPPYELRLCAKSGEYLIGEITNRPLFEQGKIVEEFGFALNITERKKAEEDKAIMEAQLRHAQKMEAVGTLTGGIAHDFNNILTIIISHGSTLKEKIKKEHPLRTDVDRILTAAYKAADLTRGLLAFSRKQIINPRPVNFNEIVTGLEKLLFRTMGEDIELKTKLADEELIANVDTGQMEQVLLNLATNARDAMPEGGLLCIETGLVELGSEFTKPQVSCATNQYILLSVTDTGKGMDEQIKERIFEPFFTTKEVGKGTGLGLAIVYGIIKQHNGLITVYSELGKGTAFKIFLPAIKSKIEKIKTVKLASPVGGTETILLAEDDVEVRKVIKDSLEEYGYTIIEAVDGEDAVKKFLNHGDKIQLLISDVIMPKKHGMGAYEEIKKQNPRIKVLFLSGYPGDVLIKKGVIGDGLNFISKPHSPNDLLCKVREVLDA